MAVIYLGLCDWISEQLNFPKIITSCDKLFVMRSIARVYISSIRIFGPNANCDWAQRTCCCSPIGVPKLR